MPDIDASLWKPYQQQGLLVFGLHRGENPEALQNFVEQTGVSFPVVVDQNSTLGDFSFPPGVGYPYPRDVVIDKNLVVRAIRNSFDVDEMTALVQSLLAAD